MTINRSGSIAPRHRPERIPPQEAVGHPRPPGPAPDRRPLAGFCTVAGLIAVLLLLMPAQHLTGDESRYLLYATSVIRHGQFVMPAAEWDRLAARAAGVLPHGLPVGGENTVLMNGVYLPALLSPIAGLFSLAGLRLASLAAGLAGLFFLLRLARRVAGPNTALAIVALTGLSIPLLPYLHLFYMEGFVFALLCWGWDRLQRTGRGAGGDLLTAAILILVPFVHMRGSVLAACLFGALLWQLRERGLHRRAILLMSAAVCAGIGFVLCNLLIYGAVTGPVNTARPPAPWQWFPVLSMQLFNVHHGLLAYAPVWALGYAGLWAGAGRSGPPVVRQALVLAIVAAFTAVGVNPGECWPARFWVLSMPMLAIGLCFWASRVRRLVGIACLAIPLSVTLLNSVLFIAQPNLFLENRQSSMTYDALHWRFGAIDPGLFLPVETGEPGDNALAGELALAAGLFVALSALAVRRPAAALPALLILLAALDLSRVVRLPVPAATTSMTDNRLHIVVPGRPRSLTLEMGHREQVWFAGPRWPRLDLAVTGGQGRWSGQIAANQVLGVSCNGGIATIDIAAHGVELPPVGTYPIAVYRSRSLIRMLPVNHRC